MIKKLPLLMLVSAASYGAASKEEPTTTTWKTTPKPSIESKFVFDMGYDADDDADLKAIERQAPVKFYVLDDVNSPKTVSDTIYLLQKREGGLVWRFEYDIVNRRARINGYPK